MILFARASYHSSQFCKWLMPIVIAAMPLAASTSNLPGSETTVLSLSSYGEIVPQAMSVAVAVSHVITKSGYFDPLSWAVCVIICIGGKYSVVLYSYSIRYGRYGGVSMVKSGFSSCFFT